MRDILLTLIVAGLLPFALKHTWIGVLLWTWFSLMNPHRMTWGFASSAPFAQVIAVVTLVSLLFNLRRNRLPADLSLIFLILFVGWMCLSTMNALFVEGSTKDLITVLKIQLMTVIAVMALRERRHIEAFIVVVLVSVGFYGVKGGLFTIASGGSARVWGPVDTFIHGNNELGLALTMIIPLANYLRLVSPNKWVRRGLLVSMLLSAAAVLGTQSRGALLAIAAMTFVLWMRSSRKLLGGIVLLSMSAVFVMLMPDSWSDRMRTIKTYKQDDSAMGRINAWNMAVDIANDRVTGAGFLVERPEIFLRYAERPEWVYTAHSIYFQALGEHGWPGLILFLAIGATASWTTINIRRQARRRPETMWAYELAGMLQVGMVGYAVGGAFLSLTYLDLAYNLVVVVIATKYWLREERWKTESSGLFKAGAPMGNLHRPTKPAAGGQAHA